VTFYSWGGHDISALTDGPEVRQWELWRLITSALPHGTPYHLIFNLYWLWVFGTLVESVFGHWRTALLFLLVAMGSGAAEYAFLEGGIGLSGVGYGLFGLLWVLSHRDSRFERAVDPNTIILFIGWFFLCIALTAAGIWRIANIAHGVGCVLGVLIGWTITTLPQRRWVPSGLVALVVVGGVVCATLTRSYVNFSNNGRDEAWLGFRALEQHHDEQAVRWCTEAVRIEPGDAGTWFNLGMAYHRLKSYKEAAAAYERAYQLSPNEPKFKEMAESFREYSSGVLLDSNATRNSTTNAPAHAEQQGTTPH
jgi:GlpG protein